MTIILIISVLLGLAVGSFLNVVVYRLPLMLQRGWRNECCELLEMPVKAENSFNLLGPRSHCPSCQQKLRWRDNIPLLSYLFLKGKCAHCQKAIAWRYPVLELLSAIITLFIVSYFGVTWQGLAALIFSWGLLALTFIDLDCQLLPDSIVLPLLWLGLLVNLFGFFADIASAVVGAVGGYLVLWLVAKLFLVITKKIGMGHGDFKLLAMLGAWLGWQSLAFIILMASLLGTIIGVSLLLSKKVSRDTPIPFGPFLALTGWLMLIWNKPLFLLLGF